MHVASYNNFPTAAGLASSAAGFACLGKHFPRIFLAMFNPPPPPLFFSFFMAGPVFLNIISVYFIEWLCWTSTSEKFL